MRGVMSPTYGYRALSTVPPRSMGAVPPFRLNHANPITTNLEYYQTEISGQFPQIVTKFPEAFALQKQNEERWTSGFTLAMRYTQTAASTSAYGALLALSYGISASDSFQVGFTQGNPGLNQLFINARINDFSTLYTITGVNYGTAYDLAITHTSPNQIRAYVNGVQVGFALVPPPDPSRVFFSIGRYSDANRAIIQHAAAWTRPLSLDEINSYFSSPNQLHLNW